MNHTFLIGRRVFRQLFHDRRFFVVSIVGPLLIIYFLKIFMDTLSPAVPVGRYIMPFAAFIVLFLSFLLCAIVLVQERAAGTMERMFVAGYRRAELIGGYIIGYFGLITLQAVVVTIEVLLLFDLGYDAKTVILLLVVNWQLAIVSVMLGIFVSTFTQHERHIFPFIPLIILPAFFLSGMLVAVTSCRAGPRFWAGCRPYATLTTPSRRSSCQTATQVPCCLIWASCLSIR